MQTNQLHPLLAGFYADLERQLAHAEARLAEQGFPLEWPASTPHVLMLAGLLGYDLSAANIDGAVQRGRITRPIKEGREYRWERPLVLALLTDCERRRAWLPGHHIEKQTIFERIDGEARMAATQVMRQQFGTAPQTHPHYVTGVTVEQLLGEAVLGETPEIRRWAVACLRARVGAAHVDPPDPLVAQALTQIADQATPEQRLATKHVIAHWLRGMANAVARPVTIADMLAGLRSDGAAERLDAGCTLAVSIGAGMRLSGADDVDVEHGAGRDVANLLGKAMAGDKTAVDALEKVLTNDLGKAQCTPIEQEGRVEA